MSAVVFMRNTDDKNVVHKEPSKKIYGTTNVVPVQIVEPCTLQNPRLMVSKEFLESGDINYFWLSDFNRYYFIQTTSLLNNGMIEVTGKLDPLYSWADYIDNIQTLIERQEYVFNPYLQDEGIIARIDRNIETQNIGSVGGQATGTHIALTTTGGV